MLSILNSVVPRTFDRPSDSSALMAVDEISLSFVIVNVDQRYLREGSILSIRNLESLLEIFRVRI